MTVKISELTEDTAPTGDDNLVMVDDVGGSPTTKRVSLENLAKVVPELAFSDAISPAALAAQTDDWAPSGIATTNVIRVALTGDQDLTGLTDGADGRMVALFNVDTTDTLTLKDEDASSAAANRFALPDSVDLEILPESSTLLHYDGTSSRWRVAGGTGGAAGNANGTIFIPAEAFIIPSSGGALQEQIAGTNYSRIQIKFEDAATQSADCKIVMPRDWDAGTLTAKVIWSTNTAVGTETVAWQLEGDRVEATGTADGTLTTMAAVDSDADGTADAWVYEDMGTVTKPASLAAEDVLFLRLSRLGADGDDDLTDDADFHGLQISYTRA